MNCPTRLFLCHRVRRAGDLGVTCPCRSPHPSGFSGVLKSSPLAGSWFSGHATRTRSGKRSDSTTFALEMAPTSPRPCRVMTSTVR
jgi:hypothetical protein